MNSIRIEPIRQDDLIDQRQMALVIGVCDSQLTFWIKQQRLSPPRHSVGGKKLRYHLMDIPKLLNEIAVIRNPPVIELEGVKCGKCSTMMPEPAEYKLCEKCRKRMRDRQRLRRKEGICTNCNNKARPGHTSCEACAKRQVQLVANWAARNRAKGLCSKCGKEPKPGLIHCARCIERVARCNKRRTLKLL